MDERSRRIEERFQVPTLIAALLVIPLLIIEEAPATKSWTTVAEILDWGTWLTFLAELVVMLIVVPNRREYLRTHPIEVITVVFTPPVLPPGLATARLLRLLQVVRLARLAPLMRRLFTLEGVEYAALVGFVLMLASATAFAVLQPAYDEWDGIYWALGTMTTAGSGDVLATKPATEVIAIVLMISGLALASLLVGAVAQRFVGSEDKPPPDAGDAQIAAELHDLAQRLERLEAAIRQRVAPPQ
jgi:voltage-gated potassium channel